MSALAALSRWLGKKKIQIEVTFAVYMFTPWEKFAFYSIVFLLFSLTFIAAVLYLPHHVAVLAGRAWYYLNGESIDVAASAREALTSRVLGDAVLAAVTKNDAAAGDSAPVKTEL